MKCYFCGIYQKIIPQKRRLYNGTMVEQCVHCFKCLEDGLKIAEERGLVSKNDANFIRGGDRKNMIISKDATGGNFLKAVYVKEHKISELIILDDGEQVTFTDKDGKKIEKIQFRVQYEGYSDNKEMPDVWTLNSKSKNALHDTWGNDTIHWKGKPIPITLSGEGEYLHIKVDELRIK